MKLKRMIVSVVTVGAGIGVAGVFALVDLGGADVLGPTAMAYLPQLVITAAPWAWKIIGGGLVILPLAWRMLRRRGGGRSVARTSIEMTMAPPPHPQAREVPKPPAPFLVHPSAGSALFTGRVAERTALTEWYKDKKSGPVRAMIAGGGAGKTALAWTWIKRDVLDQPMPGVEDDPADVTKACRITGRSRPHAVLWWSFDAPAATFSVFLDEALRYLTSGAVTPDRYLSSRSEKVDNLIKLLTEGRYLLVLDGFERELRAFARLDAAYLGDDLLGEETDDGCLCADLHAAEFLRRLAARKTDSRVLILSRLQPAELLDDATEELDQLEPADAVALMEQCGIEGDSDQIESVCAEYERDPLALRLLAGLLRDDRTTGRIRRADKVSGGLDEVLDAAFDAVEDRRRTLLSHIAVFRGRVTREQVAMFNTFADEAPLQDALDDLVARGLLLLEEGTTTYDMHRLVKCHAYARLQDRAPVHAHLARYFAQVQLPVQVNRIEELQPAIEHYHHLIGAGDFEQAYALLNDHIMKPLRDRFADQQLLMRLLGGLFDGTKPQLKQRLDRARAIDALAKACSYAGETRRAVALCEANLPAFKSRKDEAQAMLLGTIAGVQTRTGCLAAAEQNLRRLVKLTGKLNRTSEHAIAHNRLGLLLAHRGAFDESLAEFDKAFAIVNEADDRQIQSVCFSYYAQRALLMNDAATALDAAKKSRAFVEEVARSSEPDDHDYVRSGWMLGAAYIAQATDDPANAAKHLEDAERYLLDALSRCRRGDLVGFEPDLLMTGAKWHRAADKLPEAARLAADAMSIAMRCRYRLKQAEGLNFMARLALDAGDDDNARKSAKMAADAARCDGPPHCYLPALDEALAILFEIDGNQTDDTGDESPSQAA